MPLPRVVPGAAVRFALLTAFTVCAVVGVEWIGFGLGAFWGARDRATGMHPRWTNLMDAGAHRVALQRSTPTEPRLLIVGSSIAGRGFDAAAFEDAWKRGSMRRPLHAELAWLGGSTLVDHIVLAQYLGNPPPAYTVLAFARRDMMLDPSAEYALGVRIFYTPGMLSLEETTAAPSRALADRWWRTVWPGYRHRLLVQQLTLRYRPGLRESGEIDIGLWRRGDPEEMMQLVAHDPGAGATGANVALITPWATWCLSRGTQPVLWALPIRPDQMAIDLQSDGETSYIATMEAAAARAGVWFVDSSAAGRMTDFGRNDRVHIHPEGAARVTREFAGILADRAVEAESR